MAHPHRPSVMAQMPTTTHGHHDQSRRRARVQNVSTPFGARDRASRHECLQPVRRGRAAHGLGPLTARFGIGLRM
jgi:hypothetical protein